MRIAITYILFTIFCFSQVSAQDISKAKSLLEAQLEEKEWASTINRMAEVFPNNTQLSIAIIDKDKTEYIGVIRRNDTLQQTENQNAVFEIGSISKVFTSVLFSKQIRLERLSVDDKLASLLPVPIEKAPEESKEITLKMLANHTSGLPAIPQNMMLLMMADQHNPYKDYSTTHIDDYYKNQMILDNPPNTVNAYSNLGAGTLGYILTTVTGKSFETLLQEDIFQPLEMTNSTSIRANVEKSKLVAGLYPDGKETSNWDFTDAMVGCGGIKSNAVDMEKFIRKNFEDDEMYNLPQVPTFSINETLEIGLGWHITLRENQRLLWHNGGTGGYRSCMALDKENRTAVLILSNVSAYNSSSSNIDQLAFELINKL